MTKLDCNVVNCSYNADNCCRRTDIQVEGTQAKTSSETCCGSFAPKGCGCQSCHTTDVKKDTTVSCEACECKFNEDHACHAGHIGISGGHAGDLCRVNVAVGVKNLHHRRSSTATRYSHVRAVEAMSSLSRDVWTPAFPRDAG